MSVDSAGPTYPIRKRVWVQNVAVSAAVLRSRLAVIRARDNGDPAVPAVAETVSALLQRAEDAAYRHNPVPTRWSNWWRGTLIEAAYQHLHAAEAEMAVLYDDAEVEAEVPEAVARAEAGLHRDDPRRAAADALSAMPPGPGKRALLRKVIETGYGVADRAHSRLRNFRNILLVATLAMTAFVVTFVALVARSPEWVPFCFSQAAGVNACPTGDGAVGPASSDALVVALLGLTGGAVAATVSIRNLRGTSTPYDVPIALAALKLPLGALTALVALIAIHGQFVPGLSTLDSQEQVLGYAIVFGYAQQALTTLIDRRAQDLLGHVPSTDSDAPRPILVAPAPAFRTSTGGAP